MIPIAILALILAATAPEPAAITARTPVCATPSHERLIVRPDRDVCAPTLDRHGRPITIGLLPTRCGGDARTYHIDAAGPRDQCLAPK